MNSYTAETYGEQIADVYDDWYKDYDNSAVDLLAELARDGRALELGIGTGRIALPLVERGVAVHGLDASPAMVERLHAKPNGAQVPVTLGDFTEVSIAGEFALIYVVFNTFFTLSTQAAQVRCFSNVAAHLAPGGCFLMEVFVPDVARFDDGQTTRAVQVTTESIHLEVTQHDPVAQRSFSQHVVITDGQVRLYPVQIRYAWPAELDLMAQLAGLRLRERWSDWQRAPFTAASTKHISIYERAT
jgi:SAM-dependent methyltransferase